MGPVHCDGGIGTWRLPPPILGLRRQQSCGAQVAQKLHPSTGFCVLPGWGGPDLCDAGALAEIEHLPGKLETVEEELGAALVDAGGGERADHPGGALAKAGRIVQRRQFHRGPVEPGVEITKQATAHGGRLTGESIGMDVTATAVHWSPPLGFLT